MVYKARAVTDHLGNTHRYNLKVSDVVSDKIDNPWLIETVPLQVIKEDSLIVGSTHTLSEIRDNIRDIKQLDAYGTLAMYALSERFSENISCKLYINRKTICYDLFIDSQRTLSNNQGITYKSQFRKLNGLMYYRNLKTKKGSL